MIFDTQVQN